MCMCVCVYMWGGGWDVHRCRGLELAQESDGVALEGRAGAADDSGRQTQRESAAAAAAPLSRRPNGPTAAESCCAAAPAALRQSAGAYMHTRLGAKTLSTEPCVKSLNKRMTQWYSD